MKKFKIFSFISSILLLILSGCYDEIVPYGEVGEGMAQISAEVSFEPLTGINTDTRSPGNLIKSINSLTVIVYTPANKLVGVYPIENWTETDNTAMPNNSDGSPVGEKAESSTPKASFNLPNLPYGKYKIYAVANMDVTEEMAEDIDQLKATSLEWKSNVIENNQMFGYFTYSDDRDGGASGFEARELTINKEAKSHSLHAWIKRAASKVTVAFDPSGLLDEIWIYVHDVSIRDIPATCKLGEDNEPSYDELLYHYDEPLSKLPKSAKILYGTDAEGNVVEVETDEYQDFKSDEIPESVYTKWLTLSKGSGIKGSHEENANALYFYENMQGDYSDTKKYNKEVTESDIVGECITKPGEEGFKNGVEAGTYIEVTAYYVSQNIQNTTQGKIKYRFMLGKDISYNFNAQRNHHFKVTLGFNGWANQPKWNIEYYEEAPGLEVPDQFYVSYLYNQKHMLPIKIVGNNCTGITMEIVENNWAPYDPDTEDHVPPATVGSGENAFLWNKPAWQSLYQQREVTTTGPANTNTEFGFLALAVPVNDGPIDKNIIPHEWSERPASLGANSTTVQRAQYWQSQLKNYYDTNNGVNSWNTGSQRVRSFTSDQLSPKGGIEGKGAYETGYNGWQIHKVDDESKMFLVPIFTRNKSMINSSGFSGNNPYDAYQRKAVIRVTATFLNHDPIIKLIPIYQVRRIVNPKGVWRQASTNNPTFDVTMLQIQDVSATSSPRYFTPLPSEGSWKAYIDVKGEHDFLELDKLGKSHKESGNDTVYGDTGNPIEFQLIFKGVASTVSACAIVTVMYHGNNCVHKILCRQGINEPLAVIDGKAEWSSFSLYSCGTNAATTGSPTNVQAVFTDSPLALGTLYRRHNTSQGIRILNNDESFTWNNLTISGMGPLVAPGNYQFVLTNGTRRQWSDGNTTNTNTYINAQIPPAATGNNGDYDSTWGTFQASVNGVQRDYVLPSYQDFTDLNDADYGVGVLYGDNTSTTHETFDGAYGFQDPNNEALSGTIPVDKGARGMILYNPSNGNQIFFPFGKNGMGRRTQFSVPNTTYNGVLRYGDVAEPLTSSNDYYRPVPYNIPGCPGAIYWINTIRQSGYANSSPCGGWDMNYFIIDFGPYPDNTLTRLMDARPIKMVISGTSQR